MKSLPIDTNALRFLATNDPEPVVDFDTKAPKADRDGQPLYSVEILVSGENRKSEVINVKVAGKPSVSEGQRVRFAGLEARPWENNGRFGLSFSATTVESDTTTRKAAA